MAGKRMGDVRLVMLGSAHRNRIRKISLPITVLGSRPTAEVVLSPADADPSHAVIVYDGQDFWLRDLVSITGTFADHERIVERDIYEGCVIRIGQVSFELQLGDPHMTRTVWPQRLPECAIAITGVGQRLLDRVVTVVGSKEGCDLMLSHPGVADVHALLVRTCRGVWVHDLATTIGTMINGRRRDQSLINSGDRIEIGPFGLTISVLRPGSGADRGLNPALLASKVLGSEEDSTGSGFRLLNDDEASQETMLESFPDDPESDESARP